MVFILNSDRPKNSIDEWLNGLKAYKDYLESVKDRLPQSAYEFATAKWQQDFSDHESPHDGWLEELIIREPVSGERKQIRSLEIFIRLFAAYHDGYIELTYRNVKSYSFEKQFTNPSNGHGDWLYDEIRVSDNDFVLHEIDWVFGKWLIESEDVFHEWKPFEEKSFDK